MGENIRLPWGVSRVASSTLELLADEERRCLDLSILHTSILRQMVFPWAFLPQRLVEDHGDWQEVVEMPTAYLEALEELEILLSGAYDGPIGGCPVGEIYVDRGDLPGYDFTLATLIADDAWHPLNLQNVLGSSVATRTLARAIFTGPYAAAYCGFRQGGNIAGYNVSAGRSQVPGLYFEFQAQVSIAQNMEIEYVLSPSITDCAIVFPGYWEPAV